MGESMKDPDKLIPTEKELAMLRSLRADPSLAEAVEQLARKQMGSDRNV